MERSLFDQSFLCYENYPKVNSAPLSIYKGDEHYNKESYQWFDMANYECPFTEVVDMTKPVYTISEQDETSEIGGLISE
jgi:hypothetical protein